MARVHVDVRELRRAAHAHRQAYEELRAAARPHQRGESLLAFYAVECGMKAYYLDRQGCHSTEHLTEKDFGADGHDLALGLKLCRVPATRAGAPPTVQRLNGTTISTSMLHQAWRYGADLHSRQAAEFVGWLDKVYCWLEEVVE
jgi:hypothetical protein